MAQPPYCEAPHLLLSQPRTVMWSGHSCPLPLTYLLVIPTGAGANATAQWRNLLLSAAGRMPDAVRGRFYRPVKRAVSMRLDADVIAWLKKSGKGYQARANRILRERMLDEIRR